MRDEGWGVLFASLLSLGRPLLLNAYIENLTSIYCNAIGL